MANCKFCGKPVVSGPVAHSQCLEAWIDKQIRWIPVTERLPERFVWVIICREDGTVQAGCKDVMDWWKIYGSRTKRVTHWMPLPAPPWETEA